MPQTADLSLARHWICEGNRRNTMRGESYFAFSIACSSCLTIDVSSVKRNYHTDVVFEIYPVAAFAAHHLETGLEQELFRFGSGQARQFRQRIPQGLR